MAAQYFEFADRNHFLDEEWVLVSKGGGYSKWNGLNHYKLRWGKDGEYIKATKGSAMRNVKYFDSTELVFSDTGTSGLNVRLLQNHQLFVASGPGIRISEGNKYSHIALLNSRLYSYYLKIISPKLTIAAGYISKIPTIKNLINSPNLAKAGERCCELKNKFLYKIILNKEQPMTVFQAFLLTLFAGLSTGIGSLLAFNKKATSKTFLSFALGLSAGVMIYVSLVEIFANIALINLFNVGKSACFAFVINCVNTVLCLSARL